MWVIGAPLCSYTVRHKSRQKALSIFFSKCNEILKKGIPLNCILFFQLVSWKAETGTFKTSQLNYQKLTMATATHLTSVRLYTPCRWNANHCILSYFYSIVERADIIARELDASAKHKTCLGRGWGLRKILFYSFCSLCSQTPACFSLAPVAFYFAHVNRGCEQSIRTLVLFANIFVLRVYLTKGTPPSWIGKLCDFCSIKKSKSATYSLIRFHCAVCIYGARLKWLLPELMFALCDDQQGVARDAKGRGTRVWSP